MLARLYALALFVVIAALGVLVLVMSWNNLAGGPLMIACLLLLNGFGGMGWLLLDAIIRLRRRHRQETPR
jgi:UDP-N-acetylmuramyl pentapeptide phosphotransferase/UDP-N-acetylglucosamine-1-phosphate transferase